ETTRGIGIGRRSAKHGGNRVDVCHSAVAPLVESLKLDERSSPARWVPLRERYQYPVDDGPASARLDGPRRIGRVYSVGREFAAIRYLSACTRVAINGCDPNNSRSSRHQRRSSCSRDLTSIRE